MMRRKTAQALVMTMCLGVAFACNDSGKTSVGRDGGAGGAGEGDGGGSVNGAVGIDTLVPNHASTLGGDTLTVTGRGFAAGLTATLGGEVAEIGEIHGDTVVLKTPALPPGRAELTLTVPGVGTAILRDAVRIEPLSVTYDPAPEGWAEAPQAEHVHDAVVFDVEGDGDPDVVVATDDGMRVLANDGRGQLILQRDGIPDASGLGTPLHPGGHGDVRALLLADLDMDGKPEIVACTGAGRELHLTASVTGLTDRGDLPLRAGGCLAATVLPGASGKPPSLLLAVGRPDGQVALTTLLPAAGGWAQSADLDLPNPDPAPVAVGSADSADPAATQRFTASTDTPRSGARSGRLAFNLTDAGPVSSYHLPLMAGLPDVPQHVRLFARRITGPELTVTIRLIDAAGLAFVDAPLPALVAAPAPWAEVDANSPFTAEDGSSAMPTPPFSRLDIVITAPGPYPVAGELAVDGLVAEHTGDMPILVDDFERDTPRHVFPSVSRLLVGELDGDTLPDVLVLPGGDAARAPVRLGSAGNPTADTAAVPTWTPQVLPTNGPGPFNAGALLDADGDGALDALLVSGGQDRLLLGDGWGRMLDGTSGLLPVDWADGRAVTVTDVNHDGLDDLLIGNAGKSDRLYLARGDGRFLDASPELGLATDATAAILSVDLDADGDLDVISVAGDGRVAPHVRIARGGTHEIGAQ